MIPDQLRDALEAEISARRSADPCTDHDPACLTGEGEAPTPTRFRFYAGHSRAYRAPSYPEPAMSQSNVNIISSFIEGIPPGGVSSTPAVPRTFPIPPRASANRPLQVAAATEGQTAAQVASTRGSYVSQISRSSRRTSHACCSRPSRPGGSTMRSSSPP
jgi:hypothetical protein